MKSPLSPLSVATDSVAFFTAQLAYAFLIWVPILAVIVFFQLLKRGGSVLASLLTVLIIAAPSALCGIVLKWIADGILERRRIETVIHVVFGSWGSEFGLGSRSPQTSICFRSPEDLYIDFYASAGS